MVTKKLLNLSFFTKNFGRSVQLSSSFGKTFSYIDKVYQADIYREKNICTSCVFNGFKYIWGFKQINEARYNICYYG